MAFCLGNVVELLDQVLHPDQHHQNWVVDNENIPLFQSIFEKASFLSGFLANSTPETQARFQHFEDLIGQAGEHVEEYVLVSNMAPERVDENYMVSVPDLSELVQIFDDAAAEAIKIKDDARGRLENTLTAVVHSRSRTRNQTSNDVLVGVEECSIKLKERLTSHTRTLEVIPIVGMGGIGKTTLARKVYDECSSSKHFDICSWATVSQQYDGRQVLLSLLELTESKLDTEKLRDKLYKKLYSRRYLIVLDDVWSSQVWDDIRWLTPEGNSRSRIILTTRGNNVADYVSSNKHEMHLLNEKDSWELFEKHVHNGGEKCPDELEEVARKIVSKCGGLPLAVKVIGGFLSRVGRSIDLWEQVARDLSSFIAEEDEQFSGIFSWSYAYLPHYLKPCLLYIGAFPEDRAIEASRLIKLWVAEGFLNPKKGKIPEEVAGMYLQALVDRNLIFVRQREFSTKVKSYGIHDLLRDLCWRKAAEKKFISAMKVNIKNTLEDALCDRRICAFLPQYARYNYSASLVLMPNVRSLQLIGSADEHLFRNNGFRRSWFLRVLDVSGTDFGELPLEISLLINLRYLAIRCRSFDCFETRIILLKKLETLIFTSFNELAYSKIMRILDHLPQLRHVDFIGKWYPDLPIAVPSFPRLETLQSLSRVPVEFLTLLLGKLPNLQKLEIYCLEFYDRENPANNVDLTCFGKLGTLAIYDFQQLNPTLPHSLKELTIRKAEPLTKAFMSSIGALPNLEDLQIWYSCFDQNGTWEPSEGEFCNLQYLRIVGSYLTNLIADDTLFPQLVHMCIDNCVDLKEIPVELAGIETLEIIELDYCRHSLYDWATSIKEEQHSRGNVELEVLQGNNIYSETAETVEDEKSGNEIDMSKQAEKINQLDTSDESENSNSLVVAEVATCIAVLESEDEDGLPKSSRNEKSDASNSGPKSDVADKDGSGLKNKENSSTSEGNNLKRKIDAVKCQPR